MTKMPCRLAYPFIARQCLHADNRAWSGGGHTMPQRLFFAHANGFPSATYGKLFDALGPRFRVEHLPQHGHDPRFPVDDNWTTLVDELLYHLQRQPGPVWGVGHSFGGVLHLHAALRCPQYYQGVILLDAPSHTATERYLIRAAKRLGFIDRITPAGRTLGRRTTFADIDSARAYFASKRLFQAFDPECLEAYLSHGLETIDANLRLRFDPATEIRIFRSLPHRMPLRLGQLQVPLAMVRGKASDVVRRHHAEALGRQATTRQHCIEGSHMFPLEYPRETAALLVEIIEDWQRDRADAPLPTGTL
jgi:pimeloyl-ACP methyl ester carboxylesterase